MIRKFLSGSQATLLRDVVFAADDGLVTTFAILAGSTGASFSPKVAIILGLANIFADALSLGSGVYLGVKSELEAGRGEKGSFNVEGSPIKHGLITFASFAAFGFLPIIPFLLDLPHKFTISGIIVAIALLAIGAWKATFTDKSIVKSAFEVLIIGGIAAGLAYLVGDLADKII